jgi:putative ABC transport system ATP-binding protein
MLRVVDVHKRFNPGSANDVYALRGVSLDVQGGEFVTIIGTNGSGKSTLLNAVAGSFLPDSGTIAIAGEDVTRKRDFRRAKYISRVFQNPFMGTAPDMTIAENVHMAYLRGSRSYPKIGLNSERVKAYREEMKSLEMQLEDRLDTSIGSLSGGQRQAVSLLMAVITKPKILLLDEHTAALDPKSAALIIKLTKMFIEKQHMTTLMVTHSMQQALDLGTRTIMMHQGQIIDDIPHREKRLLAVDDLLGKFAELRKAERLTDEMLDELRRDYI